MLHRGVGPWHGLGEGTGVCTAQSAVVLVGRADAGHSWALNATRLFDCSISSWHVGTG